MLIETAVKRSIIFIYTKENEQFFVLLFSSSIAAKAKIILGNSNDIFMEYSYGYRFWLLFLLRRRRYRRPTLENLPMINSRR